MTPAVARNVGLFRTILAGSGRTLADAFANLEQAPEVERLTRHPTRGLVGDAHLGAA